MVFPLHGETASKRCGGTLLREVESTATMWHYYTTISPKKADVFYSEARALPIRPQVKAYGLPNNARQ